MARRLHARNLLSYQADLLEGISQAYEDMAPELEDRSRALRECLRSIQGRAAELLRLRHEESLKPTAIAARRHGGRRSACDVEPHASRLARVHRA